jgi:hypothetical protein
MRDIAALLFGSEPDEPHEPHVAREPHMAREPRELREPREACLPGDLGIFDDVPSPDAEWCRTAPGGGTLEWLGLGHRARGRIRHSRW